MTEDDLSQLSTIESTHKYPFKCSSLHSVVVFDIGLAGFFLRIEDS